MDEDEVTLDAGMPVASSDGAPLGTLSAVLIDEDTEEPGFLTVESAGRDRLVPVEAVEDVDGGTVVLALDAADFARLPVLAPDRDPSSAEIDLAYRVAGIDLDEE